MTTPTTKPAESHGQAEPQVAKLLFGVAERAQRAGVFGKVRVEAGALRCDALASAEPAEYRLFVDGGKLWVALVTAHRWLSQSIEADLVHTGDKMDELVEEELIDLGWKKEWGPTRLGFEHFRDGQKLYTFRTVVPVDLGRADAPEAIDKAATALLAYEQAFRRLGDMEVDGED